MERRTELPRGPGPKRRTELRRTPWLRLPRRESPEHREVRLYVLARDSHRCALADDPGSGDCLGRLEVHHLVKAWKRPPYLPPYLVTLCNRHNTWVEDNPLVARVMGLAVKDESMAALRIAWQRMHQRELVGDVVLAEVLAELGPAA